MKSFYIVLLAVVALLTGCDSVGSDERLIEVPAATVQRNVLIEDFTGQRCIFCPAASEAIAEQPLSIVVEVYFPKILGQDESMMSSLKQQP